MKTQLAPSILSADFSRLGEEVRAVEAAGADLIHVDVMDGRFVPPITIGAAVVRDLRKVTHLPLDVHLMVQEPDHLLSDFITAGADFVTVHVEAVRHLDRTLQLIRDLGARTGVALNPATPLTALDWVLEKTDLALIMSVNPGYGGQSFIDYCLPKIEQLRARIDQRGLKTLVQVDGGVKTDNIGRIADAGAQILVAGSAVFGTGDYVAAIRALKGAANAAKSR